MTTSEGIVAAVAAVGGWLWANGAAVFAWSLVMAALVVAVRVAYVVALALVDLRLRWRAGSALGRGGLARLLGEPGGGSLAHAPGEHSDFYRSYLQSGAWRERRARTLMLAGGACAVCGARATDAHHETYARLGAERDADLTALCESCHHAVHPQRRLAA